MNEEEQRALNALYRYCQIGSNTEPWSDGKGRFLLEHERNSKRSSTSDDSEKMQFKQTRALDDNALKIIVRSAFVDGKSILVPCQSMRVSCDIHVQKDFGMKASLFYG